MTRADLDRQMADVLTQIALCAHTPAAGLGVRSQSSDEHPGGRRPPGDLGPVIFERRYGEPFHTCTRSCRHRRPAATDEERERVIGEARTELKHLRGHSERPTVIDETLAQLKARIVKEGEGWTVKEVAMRMRCGQRLVTQARRDAGREPETGKAIPEPAGRQRGAENGQFVSQDDANARQARIQARFAQGMSIAQIALIEGVHRSTVERDLGRRAA